MTTEAQSKTDDIIADLKAQLKEEQKLVEKQTKELEALRPTRDISDRLFNTPEDVRAYFGDKKIAEMVKTRVAAENKQLNRQGFDRIEFSKDQLAEFTEELLQSFVDDRHAEGAPEDGFLVRTLKMIHPQGHLVQIPYEPQVNNIAGSLADGLLIYERKGFKRTNPFICPAGGCNEPAEVHKSGKNKGKWVYSGYCSQDHFDRTEKGRHVTQVPGSEE